MTFWAVTRSGRTSTLLTGHVTLSRAMRPWVKVFRCGWVLSRGERPVCPRVFRPLPLALRYMHRNPVKRGLVDRPEQWQWSSFRSYLFGETGPVRVKFQEWPLEIRSRPVVMFGEEKIANLVFVRGAALPGTLETNLR